LRCLNTAASSGVYGKSGPPHRGRFTEENIMVVLKSLPFLVTAALLAACGGHHGDDGALDPRLVAKGKKVFRYDTFGDEAKWTGQLRLHEVIASSVSPVVALGVGLKVDVDALPPAVREGIRNGTIDLTSPDTTVALLKLGAVVGVIGKVETVHGRNVLKSVGVTCALCHSTVDNSFAAGIGRRLDGWPNRDLNVGAIIALSPVLTTAQRAVYNSWGPGRYDPRFNIDGKNGPVEIAPAYGLLGVHSITYTGDGRDVTYWNRYVAVTQMGGLGHFEDPRLPLSVTNGDVDLVRPVLPALRAYQLSLEAPPPPPGSFDPAAASRGRRLFVGKGQCIECHVGPKFTDGNFRLHDPSEVVSEPEPNGAPSYAARSATRKYRTTPLRALWQHPPYFHNGKAATTRDVVELYNERKGLGLTPAEVGDLAEYLKSL
jgi:mono/diheme cytochrome c family protein